jgi:poly(3-hydroxybutyrate) depolymerase
MRKINLVITLLVFMNITSTSQEFIPFPTAGFIKKMDLSAGKRTISVKMSDGSKWEMMISIPTLETGKKVDLLLALHWGVAANENVDFMDCLILPSIDKEKYIVVSPIAERQAWWENPKESQLLKLVEHIRKFWPIDKVIVAGYSDGGTGSVHFASKYPDKFDGAIALAGYYRDVKEFEIPTYIIHGKKDELFDYKSAVEILSTAQKANDKLKFVAGDSLSHFQGCNYVPLLKEGFEWIEDRIN